MISSNGRQIIWSGLTGLGGSCCCLRFLGIAPVSLIGTEWKDSRGGGAGCDFVLSPPGAIRTREPSPPPPPTPVSPLWLGVNWLVLDTGSWELPPPLETESSTDLAAVALLGSGSRKGGGPPPPLQHLSPPYFESQLLSRSLVSLLFQDLDPAPAPAVVDNRIEPNCRRRRGDTGSKEEKSERSGWSSEPLRWLLGALSLGRVSSLNKLWELKNNLFAYSSLLVLYRVWDSHANNMQTIEI